MCVAIQNDEDTLLDPWPDLILGLTEIYRPSVVLIPTQSSKDKMQPTVRSLAV
jgi:hypothetical protein